MAQVTESDPVHTPVVLSTHSFAGTGSFTASQHNNTGDREADVLAGDARTPFARPSSFGPGINYKNYETRNLLMLSLVFTVYFGLRSGCLIVLPLASKLLLFDTLDGAEYSPLYQLPLGIWFLMDIIIAAPNAIFMQQYGRRAGFLLGAMCAFVACIAEFLILRYVDNGVTAFILLNIVVTFISIIGMSEFVRYAAAEACSDDLRRSTSVSRVVSGGAILSMVGPFTASFAAGLDPDHILHGYAYFFLVMGLLSIVAMVAASLLKVPQVSPPSQSIPTRLTDIVTRTEVWSAIVAQVAVQFTMVTPMSATPLAMMSHLGLKHGDYLVSGCVVSHVLGMFVPGFLTGSIVKRIGTLPVMAVGLLLQGACMVVLLFGYRVTTFYVGLILLGVGWNFAFVASTVILLSSHTPAERTKVTSLNETLRFSANGLAVILSSSMRFDILCYICLALVCIVLGLMIPIRQMQHRQSQRSTP